VACAALLIGTTACSGNSSDAKDSPAASTSTSGGTNGTTSGPEEKLPDLTTAQVVSAFAGKSYQCSTDEAYQTCSQGTRPSRR
jgi:hypothetical protein